MDQISRRAFVCGAGWDRCPSRRSFMFVFIVIVGVVLSASIHPINQSHLRGFGIPMLMMRMRMVMVVLLVLVRREVLIHRDEAKVGRDW